MCHLILFMPVLALPVFWLLPWPLATAIYVFVLAVSAWLYYVTVKLMHRPSVIGAHTLIGRCGTVVQAQGSFGLARIGGELWQVESSRDLPDDGQITVTGRHGLVLEVSPSSKSASPNSEAAPSQT